MAALVFYGGAGINVVSFCCNDCWAAGVEAIKNDKCCEIHGHDHHDVQVAIIEHTDGAIQHSHEMCCHLRRVDFDWDTERIASLNIQPIVFDLFDLVPQSVSLVPLPVINQISTVMPTGPPLCPRTYLSLLTTLLI